MANIELIKALRERTGAGIMDCKNALVACNDDIDKASDWLREKGIAKQAKKASRIAAEGLANYAVCEKCGKVSVVEVNCETDFVANSDQFKELVASCAKEALSEDVKTLEDLNSKVANLFTDATVKLGEKLTLRRFDVIEPKDGEGVGLYNHGHGRIIVAVLLKNKDDELANRIAMHIAASNSKYISDSDVPHDIYENEKKVQTAACQNDEKLKNKPQQALEKIIEGKVHKALSESVLYDQEYYLFEPGKTVGLVLKEKGNEVLRFVRYQVGEGLEKRQDNFAEEVLSQTK